jgi:glutaminase
MFESDVIDIVRASSTGTLPHEVLVADLVRQAHERYADLDDGAVADHTPEEIPDPRPEAERD